MRELAIGDIHGCARALETLLEFVQPQRSDTIIFLGDYIDRGPDSCRVIDVIIELNRQCTVVALTGNHEIMLRRAVDDREAMSHWMRHGGWATLQSYLQAGAPAGLGGIPERHWQFFEEQTLDYWETDDSIFVHAGLGPELDLDEQPDFLLFWQPFSDPTVHKSGKQIICGHSHQESGMPALFDRGICIDTWAHAGGWLTCLDTIQKTAIQANERGEHRILQNLENRPEEGS